MSFPPTPSPSPFPVGVFLPAGGDIHTDYPITPQDPTIGFKLNHFMLRIRDPNPSLNFYVNLMGMRTIFVMNTGPFTIYYLGYPQTEERRADPEKFGIETVGKLQETTGNKPPHLGFGHLGFTVPDVPAALDRLTGAGVEIVKPLGRTTRADIPLRKWEEERGVAIGETLAEYKKVFDDIAFVQDPDGHTVELVPQRMDPNNPGGT